MVFMRHCSLLTLWLTPSAKWDSFLPPSKSQGRLKKAHDAHTIALCIQMNNKMHGSVFKKMQSPRTKNWHEFLFYWPYLHSSTHKFENIRTWKYKSTVFIGTKVLKLFLGQIFSVELCLWRSSKIFYAEKGVNRHFRVHFYKAHQPVIFCFRKTKMHFLWEFWKIQGKCEKNWFSFFETGAYFNGQATRSKSAKIGLEKFKQNYWFSFLETDVSKECIFLESAAVLILNQLFLLLLSIEKRVKSITDTSVPGKECTRQFSDQQIDHQAPLFD